MFLRFLFFTLVCSWHAAFFMKNTGKRSSRLGSSVQQWSKNRVYNALWMKPIHRLLRRYLFLAMHFGRGRHSRFLHGCFILFKLTILKCCCSFWRSCEPVVSFELFAWTNFCSLLIFAGSFDTTKKKVVRCRLRRPRVHLPIRHPRRGPKLRWGGAHEVGIPRTAREVKNR